MHNSLVHQLSKNHSMKTVVVRKFYVQFFGSSNILEQQCKNNVVRKLDAKVKKLMHNLCPRDLTRRCIEEDCIGTLQSLQ